MDARRTTNLASGAAILATVALLSAAGAAPARHTLTMPGAEAAARDAVTAHSSFRQIAAPRAALVTRACWRSPGVRVRCSLYVVVTSPCALEPEANRTCAQALWQRRWLVEVRRDAGGPPAARIIRISAAPAAPQSG
jgi:hypothetical protein